MGLAFPKLPRCSRCPPATRRLPNRRAPGLLVQRRLQRGAARACCRGVEDEQAKPSISAEGLTEGPKRDSQADSPLMPAPRSRQQSRYPRHRAATMGPSGPPASPMATVASVTPETAWPSPRPVSTASGGSGQGLAQASRHAARSEGASTSEAKHAVRSSLRGHRRLHPLGGAHAGNHAGRRAIAHGSATPGFRRRARFSETFAFSLAHGQATY